MTNSSCSSMSCKTHCSSWQQCCAPTQCCTTDQSCASSQCGCQNQYICNPCGCNACGNCGCDCNCSQCSGNWPCRPNRPPMQLLPIGAILAPRVIASGRAWQRNTDVTLCIEDLPECAEPPYTLLCVTASGPADWEIIPGDRGRAIIRVTVPVLAQVRDNCCIVRTGHSSITVDVPVRMGNQSFGRHSHVTVIPWVSLACNPVSCDDACFDCSVEVLVDVYVTRWEAAFNGTTIPCRPDLPLNLPNNCCR